MDPFLRQLLWGVLPTFVAMGLALVLGRKKKELPIPGLALWLGLLAGTVGLLHSWPAFPPKTALLALPYVLLLSLFFFFASEKKTARVSARVVVAITGTQVFLNPLQKNVFEGNESLFWFVLLICSWLLLAPSAFFSLTERPRSWLLHTAILSFLLALSIAMTGSLFLGQILGLLAIAMMVLYLDAWILGPNFVTQGLADLGAMFFLLGIALSYLASSTPAGIAILFALSLFVPILAALRPKGERPVWLLFGPSFLLALAGTAWAYFS